jgi:hypothetical protein
MQKYSNWIVYLGEKEGSFMLNSRAVPGHKYPVQKAIPFPIHDGDGWVANLKGYSMLVPVTFCPTIVRQPITDLSYLSAAEAALLEGLTASSPDPARVVELGTGRGLSLSRLLYGLNLHQDAKVWSVDLETSQVARDYIASTQVPTWRYEFVQCDSTVAACAIDEPLDLIYIDASHTAEGVTKDILAWTPKLKIGGFVALHDYGNPRHDVTTAIDELLFEDGEHWTFRGRADSLVVFEKL